MKIFKRISLNAFVMLLGLMLVVGGCNKDNDTDPIDPTDPTGTEYSLGYNADNENLEEIPSDINIAFGNQNIPSSMDISQYFPPIGDQGQWGTCVAWSLGYNLKTSLDAMDNNFSQEDLTDPGKQMSPKDLFFAIPNQQKSADCAGTQFEPAFDVMINRGVATMDVAPYSGLGDCTSSTEGSWDQDAGDNKIKNYRKIEVATDVIKGYIADKRPVSFGARLDDQFMQWNSDAVYSSYTTFNNVGQHAYHAMIITGYDDALGANGAFRVLNSWGAQWGDNGNIWIDYNFFINDFCFSAFVATNDGSQVNPDDPINPNNQGEYDLIPWFVTDEQAPNGGERDRLMTYNVYNTGTQSIPASARWNISYIYYNAFDASDYGIMLYDYYTDEFGQPGDSGPMQSGGQGESGNWWNHIDLSGGTGVAETLTGENWFEWTYTLPSISGYYYLVCMADAFDDLGESNEANNLYFLHNGFGGPVYFENGVPFGLKGGGQELEDRDANTKPTRQTMLPAPADLSPEYRNAYTPDEIKYLIEAEKASGRLEQKINDFNTNRASKQ